MNNKTSTVVLGVILTLGATIGNAMAASSVVKASLTETSITLDNHTVKAGKVSFEVTNAAPSMVHEMVVLKTDVDENQLPMNKKGTRVDEHSMKNMGEAEDVSPGKMKKLTLTLKPGKYVLVCNIEGHYKAGMHTTLVVEK